MVKQCEQPLCCSLHSWRVPLILQCCHRCRNRKSIKAPMNQHSAWHCATSPAAPPLHCLSPSLNPASGTDWKYSITDKSIHFFGYDCLRSPCDGLTSHWPCLILGKRELERGWMCLMLIYPATLLHFPLLQGSELKDQ